MASDSSASRYMRFSIPLASPDLAGNELNYVSEAIKSNKLSFGDFINRFENDFAKSCGTNGAIVCANGTCALHLALYALGVKAGDEVIVPSFTYVATANAVRYCGAEPVFVDVEKDTWCLDPKEIEKAITSKTRGIIVVHLFGHPADMDKINGVAQLYNLWVVEDAAEAVLAKYKERVAGSLGTIGTFSFHSAKVFTSGEGGAITLNDKRLESFIRMACSHGMDPQRRFFFPVVGFNYRLTNLSAALLCAQFERRETILKRRAEIFDIYLNELSDIPGIAFRPVVEWAKISPWLFSILVDPMKFGHTREELMQYLASNGVESRPFFIPIHNLPPYREASSFRGNQLPITNEISSAGINLPTFNNMTNEQVKQVAQLIQNFKNSD